jgi:hypothetical protein
MTPKQTMLEVATRAFDFGLLSSAHDKPRWPRPGEFWGKGLTEEERAILKDLTSKDVSDIRADAFIIGV